MATYFFTTDSPPLTVARAKKAVRVQKGQRAMTRMPRPRSSRFSARLKLSTKALLAPYTSIYGMGWKAATEAMLMICPPSGI